MVVTKQEIEDDAFFAFRKTQANVLETGRIDCLHVSDLIKECQRMVYLNKIKPIIGMDTTSAKRLYLGQLVHNNSDMSNIHMHEVPFLYNWVTDEGVDGDTFHGIHPSTKWDYIAGSADDIRKVGDKYIICDKKTKTKMDGLARYGPSDENKLQLNMYRVLLKKNYGIDAEWGCNVYVDVNTESPRDVVLPIAYKLKPIEETLDTMVQTAEYLKDALLNKKMPPVHKCYLCDGYCPHATFCFGK